MARRGWLEGPSVHFGDRPLCGAKSSISARADWSQVTCRRCLRRSPDIRRALIIGAIEKHVHGEYTGNCAGMDDVTIYGEEAAADAILALLRQAGS